MNSHDPDNAMAADYVMGLLDDAEQAAAERRIATDQSFAQAVSAWRERLADLDLTAEETPPNPALWQRIAAATKIAPIDALPSARAALRGTTLWDYIRRAMPFEHPGTLTTDEVYGATAYVLYMNGIVGENDVLDQTTLPKVKMPNRNGFTSDPRPDVPIKKK